MRAAIYSFSLRAALLGKKLAQPLAALGYEVQVKTMAKYAAEAGVAAYPVDYKTSCGEDFASCDLIVFVGATGIAVRAIAPHIKSKATDPAVLTIDERANFMIPLLSGHIGGANELARYLAAEVGATACVTTATDVNGLFAVDEWAARNKLHIADMYAAKEFAAAIVNGEEVGLAIDKGFTASKPLPKLIAPAQEQRVGMNITIYDSKKNQPFAKSLRLIPQAVYLGIGCRRDTPLAKIEALVLPKLQELQIDKASIAAIASVDLKKDEQGLLAFAKALKVPAQFYTAEELNALEGDFTPSAFVKSIVGVSNVCERSAVLASEGGELLLRKTSQDGVTLAIAVKKINFDFNKTGLKTE